MLFLGRLVGLIVLIFAVFALILWARVWAEDPDVSLSIVTLIPTPQVPAGGEVLFSGFQNEMAPTFTPIPSVTPVDGAIAQVVEITPEAPLPTFDPSVPDSVVKSLPTSVPVPTVDLAEFDTLFPDRTDVITAAERIEMPFGVTNILLIGSDSPSTQEGNSIRTDSLLIVSINRASGSASILSVPRDLYLYIPGWRPSRINTAYARGEQTDYPGGGAKLLKDTILLNFGIPIHYYAKIDFAGFEEIINSVGGIEIVNSCELTDWILKEPGLDIQVEENYELITLEPGVHQMDGFKALWYARSRRTTSDFDRGRRQQQILGALLDKGVDLNLVPQIPILWRAFQDTIETDMDLGRAIQLASLASEIENQGIQHLTMTYGETETVNLPESGAEVQILVPDVARKTFARLYELPSLNNSSRKPVTIEIVNRSGDEDMGRVAQETLAWFGFEPTISESAEPAQAKTELVYHGNNFKGSYNWLVGWIFSQYLSNIELEPDPDASYAYQVTLGQDYQPCKNPLYAPLGP